MMMIIVHEVEFFLNHPLEAPTVDVTNQTNASELCTNFVTIEGV